MGVVLSCCRHGGSPGEEEESLLRGQQEGYGTRNGNEDNEYDAAQQQLREHEKILQARDRQLRDIVTNTNDKLIDISMISNSGIVIQSGDLHTENDDLLDNDNDNEDILDEEEIIHSEGEPRENEQTASTVQQKKRETIPPQTKETGPTFTVIDPAAISPQIRSQLTSLHGSISAELHKQLQMDSPRDLTLSF